MLRNVFRLLFLIFAYLALPVGAFYLAYRLTDAYFRTKLIALPFDAFGWAIGGAAFFWTLTLAHLVNTLFISRGQAKGPYTVDSRKMENKSMKMKIFIGFLFLVSSLMFLTKNSWADDLSSEAINEKLNQVLTNQETILARLQEVKSELEVIKVRTTR